MKTLNTIVLMLAVALVSVSPWSMAADKTAQVTVPVNINTADAKSLATALKGVGESKAKAIIAYRETYGGFKAVEELTEIKGISDHLLRVNRNRIVLK